MTTDQRGGYSTAKTVTYGGCNRCGAPVLVETDDESLAYCEKCDEWMHWSGRGIEVRIDD